jgi:hypothetical protein
MKTIRAGYVSHIAHDGDAVAMKKRARSGKARAERIVALAQGGISGQIGSTDITHMTEAELREHYRRMMRG